MLKTLSLIVVFLTLLLLFSSSQAQIVDVSECRALSDRLERFDCYESLDASSLPDESNISPVSSETTNIDVPLASAETVPGTILDSTRVIINESEAVDNAVEVEAEAIATVSSFGKSEAARIVADESGTSELIDNVVAVKTSGYNKIHITLASGQVWRQMVSKRYRIRLGDEVRIYPTGWGNSYRMSPLQRSGYIQVERIDNLNSTRP